jgi:uncharacterized protein YkwD
MRWMLLARVRTLVLLAVAAAALLAPGGAQASTNCTPDAGWGTLSKSYEAQIAVQLNQQREANGLSDLQVSPLLTDSAEWKSMHMSEYQYFAHDDPAPPVARPANQRISDCGYTYDTYIGEIIAQGYASPSDVVAAWMNSSDHRANILGPDYTVMGVGVAQDAYGVYWWTVDFGGVADPGSVPAGTNPVSTVPTTSTPSTPPPTTTAPATPPPATTTTTTTTTTTKSKTVVPTPTGGTTTVGGGTTGSGGANGGSNGIAKAITLSSHLVAKRDVIRVRPGKARVLYPLANDLDPETKPLHLVRILKQPPGSHARILHGGRAIRLRLPKHPHGKLRLIYLVSTASGIEARGTVSITLRA